MIEMENKENEYAITLTVNAFHCLRCDYKWIPRVDMKQLKGKIIDKPRICPNCKSPYWDLPKKNKSKNGKK